jgi:hypothetical protein
VNQELGTKEVALIMTLRGSSLKDCLVYDIVGPVMQNAVCLGDVDNDGANELIVGSAGGDLAVYSTGKCSDRQPWKFAKLEDGQEVILLNLFFLTFSSPIKPSSRPTRLFDSSLE